MEHNDSRRLFYYTEKWWFGHRALGPAVHGIIPAVLECVRCCYTTACCRRVVFLLQLLHMICATDLQRVTEDSPSGIVKVVPLHVLAVHTYVRTTYIYRT